MQTNTSSKKTQDNLDTGIFYKGKARISNGAFTVVNLPKNASNLLTDLVIQISPIYTHDQLDAEAIYISPETHSDPSVCPLYPSEVRNNSFVVYGSNAEFIWVVTGKYKDIDSMISNSIPKKKISTFRDRLEQDDG